MRIKYIVFVICISLSLINCTFSNSSQGSRETKLEKKDSSKENTTDYRKLAEKMKGTKFELSEKEIAALEKDAKLMEAVKKYNEQNGSQDVNVSDIFPDAVKVPEIISCARDGDLPRAKLKILLNNGININEGYDFLGVKGYTALHSASENGNLDTVKFLIENGADVNLKLKTAPYEKPSDLAKEKYPEIEKYLLSIEKKR